MVLLYNCFICLGLHKLFESVIDAYTGRTKASYFPMSPECICGCLFPPLYRQDEELPLFHQYMQQLNQAKMRQQQGNTSKIQPFQPFKFGHGPKYVFCAPFRLTRYMFHWEQVPLDKIAILLRVSLHDDAIIYSMGMLNHYWALKNHHFDPSLVYWEMFDFRGCPRTQTHSFYPVFPIQTAQYPPHIVHDLTNDMQHLTGLRLHELDDVPFGDLFATIQVDNFCVDHRMVNHFIRAMNDFYLQHNDAWYRQHFSFILNRHYNLNANGLDIYDKLAQWYLMCRYEADLANNFIEGFFAKVKNVLHLHPQSKVGKNILMCEELHLSLNKCLALGIMNEQLYVPLQQQFCQKFYQLYLPLQRNHTQRLQSLLKTKAFRVWTKDPQLRQDYEVNELISLI